MTQKILLAVFILLCCTGCATTSTQKTSAQSSDEIIAQAKLSQQNKNLIFKAIDWWVVDWRK